MVGDPSLEECATIPRAMPHLVADLVQGRLSSSHALHPWLLERGVAASRIDALAGTGRVIDVWGVNWYPQFSHYRIEGAPGATRLRKIPGTRHDLADLLRDVHRPDRHPGHGHRDQRARSGPPAGSVAGGARTDGGRLLGEGLPLAGITWFPAFSLLSWDYRRGRRPPEAYLTHFGLWDLRPEPDGTLRRDRTLVADAFEAVARIADGQPA